MSRVLRIVGVASLLMMSMAVTGTGPAGAAAAPTITSLAAPTARAGCSRLANATVQCSGFNEVGELGNGTTNLSLVPKLVQNLSGSGPLTQVVQVVTGNFFACARIANGGVDCWGDNSLGQLGIGSSGGASLLPMVVKNSAGSGPLTGVVQIAAGKYNACARLSNGGVDCWGNNSYYQLGDGTNIQRLLPHAVLNGAGHAPLKGQINISVGQYDTCSVQSDGSARCWGLNQFGVLGDGTLQFRPLPVRVKAVTGSGFIANVTNIVTAPNHTCALLKTGTMDCWGQNVYGQLGDGTTTTRLRPVVVRNVLGNAPLVHIAQITAGGGSAGDHTCVRLIAKTALCWGNNFYGQLGDASRANRHRPVIVKASSGGGPLTSVTGIVAGPVATCATLSSGHAKCWGFNHAGQFGTGVAFNSNRPIPAAP